MITFQHTNGSYLHGFFFVFVLLFSIFSKCQSISKAKATRNRNCILAKANPENTGVFKNSPYNDLETGGLPFFNFGNLTYLLSHKKKKHRPGNESMKLEIRIMPMFCDEKGQIGDRQGSSAKRVVFRMLAHLTVQSSGVAGLTACKNLRTVEK